MLMGERMFVYFSCPQLAAQLGGLVTCHPGGINTNRREIGERSVESRYVKLMVMGRLDLYA